MTYKEKTELVKLLSKYQDDLIKQDFENKDLERKEKYYYEKSVKAKYEHARKIKASLEIEIEKEILAVW